MVGLHGLATANRLLSLRLTPLADRARLFFPDLLGHGQSPWPECAYGLRDHLDALDAWRSATGLGDEPIYLVGVSLGAILALHYAVREREWYGHQSVRGIAAISTPAYPDPRTARSTISRGSPIAYLTVRHPRLAARLCGRICGLGGPGWTYGPRIARWLPTDVVEDTFAHCWRSLSGTLDQVVLRPDIQSALAELPEISVVFIHGNRDLLAPLRFLQQALVAQPRPNFRLTVLPGAGHDAIATRTSVIVEAIARLLAQTPIPTLSS